MNYLSRWDIADANALAVVAKWREEKEAQNPGEEVCLRNEPGTRRIKVHGNGRNNQFSINGGNAVLL